MITANGVSLRYGDGTLALNNINLEIKPGELIFITGPSGSGKTSLLKLFMGIEFPSEGVLTVFEKDMNQVNQMSLRKIRCKIGPIFQEFKLIQGRSAKENIIMGMRFLKIPPKIMRENAENALGRVGLTHKAGSYVEHLSWGEAQRIAIARAVARKPALILADEPTGNLDHENAVHILKLLSSFRDSNTTVIITTHATHLIDNLKNAVYIHMNGGTMQIER